MSHLMLTIPKEVTKLLKKIETLEKKESVLMENYNGIVATCGYCQIPDIGHRTLDKAIEISKKKYKIWKDIRGFVFGGLTLWQLGINSKYPVSINDNSELLQITTKEIKKLIALGVKNQ
jgi:hypothetical protein